MAILPACSSGGGGDNGSSNPRDEVTASGLTFSYPFDGQDDVLLTTQMVVDFDGDVNVADDGLELQGDDDTTIALTIDQDDNQPEILRLMPASELQPNTHYDVVATSGISGGNTSFSSGSTLFGFDTRPAEGTPAADGFEVSEVTPGNTNEATGRTELFTQFNAIRVILSEPVDPATVNSSTFTVTGPDGEITDARLTALGRYIVFDPTDDLEPGDYTIAWTDGITSEFGNSLAAGNVSRTVLSVGDSADEHLTIPEGLGDNDLDGGDSNLVNISTALIGSNDQPASNSETRGGVRTTLAEPGLDGFGDTFPTVIRGGQKFQLTGLNLQLNGKIATPIAPSGPIDVNFINDVSVYLAANDYRNIETPTQVRLRFDLGIATLIDAQATQPEVVIQALANGVFNQSVLNIQAAGLAVLQDNGDLKISSLGSFPINVNRTDNATVDFELTFILPAGEQQQVQDDEAPPYVIAQSPSACLYTFGSPAYDPAYATNHAPPTALPEQACNQVLANETNGGGRTPPYINSFPIEASPAIVFNEPIDPASVNVSSVTLTGPSGDVDATYRVEGTTVVVDPVDLLEPDTSYTINLNSSADITDLAGNAVTADYQAGPGLSPSFTTEPHVDSDQAPPLLGTLTPGVPCALDGGDFESGGNNAGNCVGDTSDDPDFPVFESPTGVHVEAFFSKLVRRDSIVLADGCLTGGGGNSVAEATVAIQEMDGSQCVGAVPGELAFGNRTGSGEIEGVQGIYTRSFTFRPASPLEPGTRYWIVICGTESSNCTNQIVDANDRALNTDPLNGTGSTLASQGSAGGPDIVMPFDTVGPTEDYYADFFTLPEADTNGNGQFDDGENAQPGNRALVALALGEGGAALPLGSYPAYLSLTRPVAIRANDEANPVDCSAVNEVVNDSNEPAAGATPSECIQVSLLPGGVSALTGINIGLSTLENVLGTYLGGFNDDTPIDQVPLLGPLLGGLVGTVGDALANVTGILNGLLEGAGLGDVANPVNTGRILLRFPTEESEDGQTQVAQSGYIVDACQGAFADGTQYDFEPCFVASLELIANAPDGQGVSLDQQRITANVVGPVVTFEQNGRLVISLRNVNTLTLQASALGVLPATATIEPTGLNYQLVGSPTHGGREFPDR